MPEHHAKLFVDTDQTLSWWAKVRLEREANRFAADLLFQGKRFTEQALGFDTSLRGVVDLAPQYAASYEAAFRRYAEYHVLPCALIVYEKVSRNEESFVEDDEYKIQYTITSPPFRRLYFAGLQMTDASCKAAELFSPSAFWTVGSIVEKELPVHSQGKEKWRFATDVFSNGYKIFQFLKRPLSKPKG